MGVPALFDPQALAGGGVAEEIQEGFQKLWENALDLNTDPKKPRSMTVEYTVIPEKNRQFGGMRVSVKHKLAPKVAQETTLVFDRDAGGKAIAAELQQDNSVKVIDVGGEK